MSYRVMVVDDSAFMRKIISDLIEQEEAFEVQATAKNGREAIEQIARIQPDLVTMDVEMPEMNGLDALKVIMKEHPLPVIMLSGINEQGMRETIMALELGAFDFIRKPSATTSSHDIEQVGRELREQIRAAMQAKERREAWTAAQKSAPPKTSSGKPKPPSPTTPGAAASGSSDAAAVSPAPPAGRALAGGEAAARAPLTGGPRPATRPPAANPAAPGSGREAPGRRQAKAPAERARPTVRPAPTPGGETKAASPARQVPPPQQPAAEAAAARETAGGAAARGRPGRGRPSAGFTDLVAIGTSTGGPKALKAVLEKIPGDFPAPIVIVQHMPPNFTKSLAQRLNSLCDLNVVEAEEGQELQRGTAYIAPGGFHLNVVPGPAGSGYRVHLTKTAPCNGHRPSVDILYESLLPLQALKRHIVLLTGMGSDGAKVMKRLYDAGVTSTIAESEETCVVFGMPRSAIELKCVSHVLPLYEIGPKLVQEVAKKVN